MHSNSQITVAVGLSGGVDSSVAAYLLKEQGYNVIGIYMQNWHDTTGTLFGDCPWKEDLTIAQMVADKLSIPFYHVDLSEVYRTQVVDYLFEEYRNGRTPNPDVLCNREIKFGAFYDIAKQHNADFVATGHYCRKEVMTSTQGTYYRLLSGLDINKDQSYFLSQVSQAQLAISLFPIGHLQKSEVRQIATSQHLPTAEKKDSQGICFVGKVDLPVFLQQQLARKEGVILEIPKNVIPHTQDFFQPYSFSEYPSKEVGKHIGAHFYTVGQRKGLGIGGHIEPLFIIGIDVINNIIYVGEGEQHPLLLRRGIILSDDVHWIRPDKALAVGEECQYDVRIRYRQPLQKARLLRTKTDYRLLFDVQQKGVACGQFAAWYEGEELIGSGVIGM